MKLVVLVVALAHVATCGNVGVRTSSLLSPAGVTYVDGSFHAGLAAGPVGYSASIAPQPIYQSAVAAAPAAVAAQPVFHAAAPVAYAAAPRYAAVPTVQHVQGVADVPVTRIEAQPAVIQKTVDVARPAVKTQRYEVRRPAIQKQFYDIEERVVVRPAGSAVVELDEPLSRTQKGPSVIQPTGDAVAVSSPAVAVSTVSAAPAVPAVSAVSPAPVSASLPSVEINLARSSLSAAPVQATSYSGPAFATQSVGISQIPVKTVTVSTPIHSAPISGVSSISVGSSGISAVSPGTAGASFTTPAPQYPQQQVIQSTPRPDLSDSVSIDSADFTLARASGFSRSAPQPIEVSRQAPQPVELARQAPQPIELARQAPQPIELARQAPQSIELARQAPQPELVRPVPSSSLSRQSYQSSGPQTFPAPAPAPSRQAIFRSELTPRFTAQASVAPRTSLLVNYPNAVDFVQQPQFRASSIYSERNLQSEINHDNQQKLIQLLTARGGVSEVGFARSGSASGFPVEAGEVRARVISATPAPAYSAPAGERVNTRRVVVSRPIETLQEVEVAEPVTKYERVQVDQPTLIKTARQDVVRVPTSVPVYGKAFAPIDEHPLSAISADWQ